MHKGAPGCFPISPSSAVAAAGGQRGKEAARKQGSFRTIRTSFNNAHSSYPRMPSASARLCRVSMLRADLQENHANLVGLAAASCLPPHEGDLAAVGRKHARFRARSSFIGRALRQTAALTGRVIDEKHTVVRQQREAATIRTPGERGRDGPRAVRELRGRAAVWRGPPKAVPGRRRLSSGTRCANRREN